ncbi:MAG: hypothetical protein AB8H03_19810 [Saprospiraceae bacterium]
MILNIFLGLISAVILLLYTSNKYPIKIVKIWGNALLFAAIIYVGFAIFGQNWKWLPIELGGVIIYGIFVFLSKKYSPYFLAIGWATHVFWDLVVHPNGHPGYVPEWYPGVCLGFDIAIAVYFVWYIFVSKNP